MSTILEKPLSLKERLPLFARSIQGCEAIDNLELTDLQKSKQKADFFFAARRIICETKTFSDDPAWKIEDRLRPYQRRPEWPIFYGAWELSKVLRRFPDGASINRRVFEAVTNAIQAAIADANRQIRNTKQTFNLPDSGGLLILGNDSIRILSPLAIAHRVSRTLKKRTPSGHAQFPHINTVWMISENYVVEVAPGRTGIPALIYQNDVADPVGVESFANQLQTAWAVFHGVPLLVADNVDLDAVPFREHPLALRPSKRKSRWEVWQDQYDQNPYLADLPLPRLIRRAEQLFAQMTPGLLKGATPSQTMESQSAMPCWTHFLREVQRRGLDMRNLSPMLRILGKRFREGQPIHRLSRTGRNDLCPCNNGKKFKHCHGRPVRAAVRNYGG